VKAFPDAYNIISLPEHSASDAVRPRVPVKKLPEMCRFFKFVNVRRPEGNSPVNWLLDSDKMVSFVNSVILSAREPSSLLSLRDKTCISPSPYNELAIVPSSALLSSISSVSVVRYPIAVARDPSNPALIISIEYTDPVAALHSIPVHPHRPVATLAVVINDDGDDDGDGDGDNVELYDTSEHDHPLKYDCEVIVNA
jgi:hypothetical protein